MGGGDAPPDVAAEPPVGQLPASASAQSPPAADGDAPQEEPAAAEAGAEAEEELTEEQQLALALAEAEEQTRRLDAFWAGWAQYEGLNASAVDGHAAEGYNGIYLPVGECGGWPGTRFSAAGARFQRSRSSC